MKVAYYKGCLASLSAKELDISTQALAPLLELELEELESVTCCGAGDIHEAEPDYYLHLNARILAYAEATGSDTLMTICNVCTLNLRQANWQLKGDEPLRERVNRNLAAVGVPAYSGNVDVKHFLWLIAEGEGYELLKQVAHKGLKGLKVAPFYGCQILRPSKIMGFEDPDRPWSLEAIIEACGGEAIDYPAKIKCCGFPIIQAREETALGELIQPIEQALEAGGAGFTRRLPGPRKLGAACRAQSRDLVPRPPTLASAASGTWEGVVAETGKRNVTDSCRHRRGRSRLGVVRGGMGPTRDARSRAARSAGRAARPEDRAPVRLPPRRSGPGRARRRERRRMGRAEAAGSDVDQRRPAHPRLGGGAAAPARLATAALLRNPRQPRPRDQPRPVLGADVPARARAGHAALRRGRDARAARPARLRCRRRPTLALGPHTTAATRSRRP